MLKRTLIAYPKLAALSGLGADTIKGWAGRGDNPDRDSLFKLAAGLARHSRRLARLARYVQAIAERTPPRRRGRKPAVRP